MWHLRILTAFSVFSVAILERDRSNEGVDRLYEATPERSPRKLSKLHVNNVCSLFQ